MFRGQGGTWHGIGAVAVRIARGRVLGFLVALAGLWAAAFAPGAAAACQTGAVTFTATGAEQCYTVSPGVSEVSITAVGGKGGDGLDGVGGFGAVVGGEIPVTAGETLFVEVGGNGVGRGAHGATFGGGGDGGSDSGAGGGASDVRTVPAGQGSSLNSRVLVAGGGGGGALEGFVNTPPFIVPGGSGGSGGADLFGAGGAGGNGQPSGDATASSGAGGAGGTASGGGAGGTGGSGTLFSGTNGNPGVLGTGGSGSAGAGGGGYYGGGSGGEGGFSTSDANGAFGGGGAGSSFVAPFVVSQRIATDTSGTPEVMITPQVAALSFAPLAGVTFPGTQPEETISAPQTIVITNTGPGPLQISSLTFAGSDLQDFLITANGCLGAIPANASCPIRVSFAPQAQGARNANLLIASNDPSSPASVLLSGTGGQLPQGAPGQTGATGQTGQTGATGPQGPAGKIELVVCHKVSKTTTSHGHRHKTTVQRCTTRLVSGTVKFTTDRADLGATVSRAGVTYATGLAIPTGTGHWQLVLTHRRHTLRPGRYTLTLRSRQGTHRIVQRTTMTIA